MSSRIKIGAVFLLIGLALMISFTNCAKFAVDSARGLASATAGQSSDPRTTALQDVPFSFKPSDSPATGNFSIDNLPAWASFDAKTGTVSGISTTSDDSADFTIVNKSSSGDVSYGPYHIHVNGNPLKMYQWHLNNIGQKTFALKGGTTGEDIHLSQTIASGVTGSGVKVAISDTGFFETHPGLTKNVLGRSSRNYLLDFATTGSWLGDSTPDVSKDGDLAHGTAVAGLVAEKGWTGFGGRGVAPNASIAGFLYVQAQDFLSTKGLASRGYLDQYDGDFDVFNFSWGFSQCQLNAADPGLNDKLAYGTSVLRQGKGAIYLKAAGNEFQGLMTTCDSKAAAKTLYLGNSEFAEEDNTPYMMVIGAVNAKGESASYSSPGPNVWVSAPGGEFGYDDATKASTVVTDPALLTTDAPGCGVGFKAAGANAFDRGGAPNTDCYHTTRMNGTSGATPIVTGVVAFLLEANPNLTWRDVKHILAMTADKSQPTSGATQHPTASANLAGYTYQQGWVTNAAGISFHNWFGFGRVNVDKAVAMAKGYTSSLGTMKQTNSGSTWKYDSGAINLAVPDAQATGITSTLSVTENYVIEGVQAEVVVNNCIGQIGVELTSPSGTKSILMNINSFLEETSMDHVFLSNAFYGEKSAGTWTAKVVDGASGCQATWKSWKLNVIGH